MANKRQKKKATKKTWRNDPDIQDIFKKKTKNVKSKISRTKKTHGIDLSKEVELKTLDDFRTRRQFYNYIKELEKVTSRSNKKFQFVKNENGISASKQEIEELKKNTIEAQKYTDKMKAEIENKPFFSSGKKQGTVGEQRPNASGLTRPEDFDFSKIKSRKQFEYKKEKMRERASLEYYENRTEEMQQNFMKRLLEAYNSDAQTVVDELKKVSPDDFYEMYLMFDEFDFNLYYPIEGVEDDHEKNLQQLESYIEMYRKGEINLDMKELGKKKKKK